jgi:muramoyltetrapeptide carboxypeptidase
VAAFAASSPFDATLVWRGLGWLSERYRVVFEPSMFTRTGYLAGSDDRRADELVRWLADDRVEAVIAARGGYGLSRIVDRVDWSHFAAHPKWIVGFSDVTALHVEAARVGVRSIHGPNVAGVGRADRWSRERFVTSLESPDAPFAFEGLTKLAPGSAEGPLVGGNLTLLHACAAAGRLVLPWGTVLLLEDVTERPYRIDRMLTTLAPHLRRVSAIVLGEWTDCGPGPDRVTVDEVLRERLSGLGIPVVSGAPIGHGRWNAPVILGRKVRVDASAGVVCGV